MSGAREGITTTMAYMRYAALSHVNVTLRYVVYVIRAYGIVAPRMYRCQMLRDNREDRRGMITCRARDTERRCRDVKLV